MCSLRQEVVCVVSKKGKEMELEVVNQITFCICFVVTVVASVFWLKYALMFASESKKKPSIIEQIFGNNKGGNNVD